MRNFERYSKSTNRIEDDEGNVVYLTDEDMRAIITRWEIAVDTEAFEERQEKEREALKRWINGEPTPAGGVK